MKRQIYGLLGMVAIVALGGACKDDPLADTGGSPSRLDLEFAYREVIIGDSVRTFAIERDALNTPLPPTATIRSCTPAVATVATVSDAPQQRTGFFVKGLTYGTTCVIAEAGVFSDTMQVATFPARLLITSGPDTIVSGTSGAYTFQYVDRGGAAVAGVPAATWSVADTTFGVVTAAGGVVSGRDSGLVTLAVAGIGSPPQGLGAQRGVLVVPAPFTSTITPNPADPGQTVKVSRGAGPVFDANTTLNFSGALQVFVTGSLTADSVKVAIPDLANGGALTVAMGRMGPGDVVQHAGAFTVNTPAVSGGTVTPSSAIPGTRVVIKRAGGEPAFDANTRIYFGGVRTFVNVVTADSVVVPVPGIGGTGAKELRMTRLDVSDVARRLTFTSPTASFADQYDGTNNNPTTAPVITANGDYFVVLSGACANGAGGGGTDCDDFFKITNNGGAPATVTINVAWLAGADIDVLLGSDPVGLVNFDCDDGCGGATGANPENTSISVPAGATYYLWLNLFAASGASTVARIRVGGLP
jgi:hypothetical protein